MFQLLRRYRELLAVAVLLVLPLLLYLAGSKAPGERNAVDRALVTVAAPVEKAVVWAVEGVQDVWSGYVWLVDVREENLELRRENLVLRGRSERVSEMERENERLRRLLDFASVSERPSVVAPIIGVGTNPALARTVRLGKGSRDGVTVDLPVVTPLGVVGRVVATGPGWADVLILADPNSAVAAQVSRSRARVTVRGTGELEQMRLDHALRTDDIADGDLLVTAGTAGIFPKGLNIGRVTGVSKQSYGMFQEAYVVPAVDLSRIEELVVLLAEPEPEVAAEVSP